MHMVLLTGANGHLGANLLRRLLADGEAVRVLLRRDSDNSSVENLKVEQVFGDLRDPASLAPAVKGVDHIYHCAAQISTIAGRKQAIFANNVLGTRNLLAAALQHRVRRVVVTSSLSAVGHRIGGPADETEPFNPFDEHLPYAVSKAAAEHECLKAVADGLDVVIAISCAIVGPNDFKPSRMGQVLIDYANGRLRAYIPGGFEFVTARDIVEGQVLAMRRGRSGHRYIFSSEFMTLDAIFDVYRDLTGRPKPLRLPTALMMAVARAGDLVHRYVLPRRRQLLTPAAVRLLRAGRRVDCSKARHELGYRPTPVADGLREAYDWFVARGAIRRRQQARGQASAPR
jgi:nucleoside-diphosphate-sugar epimerase